MREQIGRLLDRADAAIASADGLVAPGELLRLAQAVRALRTRLDCPDEVVFAALAGGTGSGKSSLLNALAGDEIAEVGGIRPTTDRPLAVASASLLETVSGYLDEVGIELREPADLGPHLCLIDLPDTDSVDLDHRLRVESLLPKVDVVVWVVDPEKYRDAALHNRYLRQLAAYEDQLVFVMNQIDRVAVADRHRLMADFEAALVADGIRAPAALATAADPPAGPPQGTDVLRSIVEGLAGGALRGKARIDLQRASAALAASLGEPIHGFDDRAAMVVEEASDLIVRGEIGAAVDVITDLLSGVAERTGPATRAMISEASALVPTHVIAAAGLLAGTSPGQRPGDYVELDVVADYLRTKALAPLRDILRQRAEAIAAVTDLSLSVATARSGVLV